MQWEDLQRFCQGSAEAIGIKRTRDGDGVGYLYVLWCQPVPRIGWRNIVQARNPGRSQSGGLKSYPPGS